MQFRKFDNKGARKWDYEGSILYDTKLYCYYTNDFSGNDNHTSCRRFRPKPQTV